MTARLCQMRAELQIRSGRILAKNSGIGSDVATDCVHFLMPESDGGKPTGSRSVVEHSESQVRCVARAVLATPEVTELLTTWNNIVSRGEDPLRFVRKWASD